MTAHCHNCMCCLLEIWNNACQIELPPASKEIQTNLQLSVHLEDSIGQVFKTLKKIQYSRHCIFGNWDESRDQREGKESTVECQEGSL